MGVIGLGKNNECMKTNPIVQSTNSRRMEDTSISVPNLVQVLVLHNSPGSQIMS